MTNWTLKESIARMQIPFGVAYGTDTELVCKAALEAADQVPFTMESTYNRKPDVLLVSFGDSSLNFLLRIWVDYRGAYRPLKVKAAFYWALERKFREYGLKFHSRKGICICTSPSLHLKLWSELPCKKNIDKINSARLKSSIGI